MRCALGQQKVLKSAGNTANTETIAKMMFPHLEGATEHYALVIKESLGYK